MKALFIVLGLITGGLLIWWLWKKYNPAVAGTGGVAPMIAPNVPSPTLCSQLVQTGAALGSASQGGPPISVPNGQAQTLCNMGEAIGKGAVAIGKFVGNVSTTVGKTVASTAVTGAKAVAKVGENIVKDPLGSAVAVPGAALKYTVGAGVNAVFGDTGHYLDKQMQAAILKKNPNFNGQINAGQCSLRQKSNGVWVDNKGKNCIALRKSTGLSNT